MQMCTSCFVSVKLQDVSAAISAISSATVTSTAICLLTHDVMVSAQLHYDSSLVLCQLKCYLKAQQQLISCQLRCTQSVSNQWSPAAHIQTPCSVSARL